MHGHIHVCTSSSIYMGVHEQVCAHTCAWIDPRVHRWIHVCMDETTCAWVDPCVHGWIHIYMNGSTCAWIDPHVRGSNHMCASRFISVGMHEQMCTHMCTDGFTCAQAAPFTQVCTKGSTSAWMDPCARKRRAASTALGVSLLAAHACRQLEPVRGHEVTKCLSP